MRLSILAWAHFVVVTSLASACSSSSSDGSPAPEPYPTCRYENPFSSTEECRGYLGAGWTLAAVEENCSEPFTSVVGDLSTGFCETEGAIGTCTEDPDGELRLVTWFYGGDPGTAQSACEGFAGGVWSDEVDVPGGSGVPRNGEVMQEGIDAMASNAEVAVTPPDCADGGCLDALVDSAGAILFTPTAAAPEVGFILYPGAGVDPRAYAPAAQAIAREGYLVAVVPMKDGLAFNGVDRADDIMSDSQTVGRWFLGGHSMGGVSAARYARDKGPELTLDGLVLWASFPSDDDDLSGSELSVTSIFGSEDLLSTVDEIEDTQELLPSATRYVEIPGGNHAQFGYYGEQAGDGDALVERDAQQQMVVAATLHFIRSVVDGFAPTHPGFAPAESLAARWCSEAQRIVASFDDAVLPDDQIDDDILQETRAFGESKAAVDADASPPLSIRTQLRHAGNDDALYAPPVFATEVWCKLKNQESIVAELALPTAGPPQTCVEVNRAALAWALDQLSADERNRYETSGRRASFLPDDTFETGVEWLTEGELETSRNGSVLEVTSASLPVPLDANAPEEFLGVHYCKLWSPAAALRFVLE